MRAIMLPSIDTLVLLGLSRFEAQAVVAQVLASLEGKLANFDPEVLAG